MYAPNTPDAQALLERLQSLSDGLLFLSESDYPFELVYYPQPPETQDLASLLPQWLGLGVESKVMVEELSYFFQHHTSTDLDFVDEEKAQQFRELQTFLEENLPEVQVYRVGIRRITAFILGRTAGGDVVGLKTTKVEVS
jgi:histidine triad (HIT) family protein